MAVYKCPRCESVNVEEARFIVTNPNTGDSWEEEDPEHLWCMNCGKAQVEWDEEGEE